MGAVILHGVDAHTMNLHTDLKWKRFDRIVFNFPHAGFEFRLKEDDERLIKYVHWLTLILHTLLIYRNCNVFAT